MKTTVLPNQSIFDIALQTAGNADAALTIADKNGLDLSTALDPGKELETGVPAKSAAVAMLSAEPSATGITDADDIRYTGIGFMTIEDQSRLTGFWVR